MTKEKRREEVARERSKKMPPRKGRKKRSTMGWEKSSACGWGCRWKVQVERKRGWNESAGGQRKWAAREEEREAAGGRVATPLLLGSRCCPASSFPRCRQKDGEHTLTPFP